jgi:acetolactate synthase I/II/III large subunit
MLAASPRTSPDAPHAAAAATAASHRSVAEIVARFLVARGVDRIFGLQGGHIQPIWDHLARLGVRIVDVRDEGAAVHMAHAHAQLSGGVGIAMATAGPGVTNCVTAMTHAHLERVPVLLIGGCPPVPQDDLGPLQGIDHVAILAPVTRHARTLRVAEQIARDLDKAWALAEGDGGAPGPVYVEIPTDVLRESVHPALVLQEHLTPKSRPRLQPDAALVAQAAALLRAAHRPLVITGRGARVSPGIRAALTRLLDASGAVYLDTQESRGLVDGAHPGVVGAVRARAMQEADLVLVVGRKLDYQVAYGSPAVFKHAKFIRIADHADELRDNRRGEVELLADAGLAVAALADTLRAAPGGGAGQASSALDTAWTAALRAEHVKRAAKHAEAMAFAPAGRDGHLHPNRIFAALRKVLKPDAITVADGGDLLSFARMGLESGTYLDAGAFGCLGVGTPYAVAAALLHPDRQVVAITGDGAFGFNAMEIDTAKRHGAKAVFIVSNNAAWNIERLDQEMNYGGRIVGTLLASSDYAAMARAFGLHAERVTDPARLEGAIRDALAHAPALIDVVTTQDALSSDAGKGLGWVPDRQALTAWDEAEQARRT